MPARVESGFVPLPKVEQEQPEDNIKIYLNLPVYVDQDRIGINLSGIARLCELGGIRPLIVLGQTSQDTSHVLLEVAGLNSDGSAIASKKMTKVAVPLFEADSQNSTRHPVTIAERWKGTRININVAEMGHRVSDQATGVQSTENWTRELNALFKGSIREAGNQNLLHNLEPLDKLFYLTSLIAYGSTLAEWGLGSELPFPVFVSASVASFFVFGGFFNAVRYAAYNPDHRQSIFLGFQVDRAIALGVTSRTRTLVKDLHPGAK
jgi:hypothetical protein